MIKKLSLHSAIILSLSFCLVSAKGFAQSDLDKGINTLKRIYAESVKYMDKKIYYNKIHQSIDLGSSDFQIPLNADVVYNFDTTFHPAEHTLIFKWKNNISDNLRKVFPDAGYDSFVIIFKTKDACYQVIDAIENVKQYSK